MQLEVLKATTETKEITYKVAYGLPLAEQFRWGLYVSNPRNFRETEMPFPEPALFLLNPDGELQIVDYSNSPFARPDLRILVEGELFLLGQSSGCPMQDLKSDLLFCTPGCDIREHGLHAHCFFCANVCIIQPT